MLTGSSVTVEYEITEAETDEETDEVESDADFESSIEILASAAEAATEVITGDLEIDGVAYVEGSAESELVQADPNECIFDCDEE